MSKEDVFEIVIKSIGILLFIYFLKSFAELIAFTLSPLSDLEEYSWLATLRAIPLVLYFLSSVILVWKGHSIAMLLSNISKSDSKIKTEERLPCTRLSFWIVLIGAYYFVSSAAALFSRISVALVSKADLFFLGQYALEQWRFFLSQGLVFIFSLLFIFKSRMIENLITRKSKGKT